MFYEKESAFLEGTYLISANSENGFYGYFDKVFSPYTLDKLLIIHGGSGTGKSSAMRKIAVQLKEEGALVEEIRCSSDPDSLDGVLLHKNEKTVGIVDGTHPHARIALLPGLRDEEWDFSRFLDEEALQKEDTHILDLQRQKKKAYQRAYALLAPAAACHREALRQRGEKFHLEAAALSARRLLQKLLGEKDTRGAAYTPRFIRAFSMKGERALEAWAPKGTRFVEIRGDRYSAECYLSALSKEAKALSLPFVPFSSPLCAEALDGLYFPLERLAIVKHTLAPKEKVERTVYATRFLSERRKGTVTPIQRIEEELKSEALLALEEAASLHFALEALYSSHMDFEGLSQEVRAKGDALARFLEK